MLGSSATRYGSRSSSSTGPANSAGKRGSPTFANRRYRIDVAKSIVPESSAAWILSVALTGTIGSGKAGGDTVSDAGGDAGGEAGSTDPGVAVVPGSLLGP